MEVTAKMAKEDDRIRARVKIVALIGHASAALQKMEHERWVEAKILMDAVCAEAEKATELIWPKMGG